ncbi:hypothetical protein ACFY19_35300 [Streptosporangium saharense]|uniref:hypothetical protein n=1 Tax=Streptosporangium saharense TaxID=1706840 RepID=UPI00367E6C01
MRSLKTLVVALLTTVALLAVPALAQAAPTALGSRSASATTGLQSTTTSAGAEASATLSQGKPNPCKRFKSSWKKWLICQAVMKAGGMALWNKLEQVARKGWTHFKNHPTVKRYVRKNARGLYCILTLKC